MRENTIFGICGILVLLLVKGYLENISINENTKVVIESGTILDKRIRPARFPASASESFLLAVKGSNFIKELEVTGDKYLSVNKGAEVCIKNYRNKSNNKILKSEIEECK